ncbi:MAG: twin-arginine translocation pathway signal protein, partial [Acidobacteria bacterium]|nr:twin-arginine translocation pathway signal protein [Acidobacteriota bacterium]
MPVNRRSLLQSAAMAAPLAAQTPAQPLLPSGVTRPWISADFWTNPLQDWRLADGRLECIVSGGDRNAFVLTHESSTRFRAEVELGPLGEAPLTEGFAGFRIGIGGYFKDYRDSAVRGIGLDCGVATDGRLFIGELRAGAPVADARNPLKLTLAVDGRRVTLTAGSVELTRDNVPEAWTTGGIAVVCHAGPIVATPQKRGAADTGFNSRRGTAREGNVRFWFRNLRLQGGTPRPERVFGPLLFNQYTVTRRTLKMSVQCGPLDAAAQVELQIREGASWKAAATAPVDIPSATALLRVENWDGTKAVPYRVRMNLDGTTHTLTGTIARDPLNKPKLVIGALTCQNDLAFPHTTIFNNLSHAKPDILFFTGDQIYERSGDYGNQMTPAAAARLDYLRKWFLFGWTWGKHTANIPCVCLPDDHDVYHGNLWGCGGRKAVGRLNAAQEIQDSGGYKMPADWVNMVQRTQTCHLPDPPDAAPVDQGITVHYCHVQWGGMSFAVLEDRKWKSAPKEWMPEADIYNGWPRNESWDARNGDKPGAQMLGPRQEKFLEDWASDWSNGTFIKAAVSATIFCNLATLPPPATTDAVTGKLPVQPVGGYAEGEVTTRDHDSNAWPQTRRNAVLRSLRKALAFHIAGDQHLASTVQYGIEDWNDAAFALCTPAISNVFPR